MKALWILYGTLSALFTVFHGLFWCLLDWPATLMYMNAEHRALVQTFNFTMLPLFPFFAYAYFALRQELTTTRLGRAVLSLNVAIFAFRSASDVLFGDIRSGDGLFFCTLTAVLAVLYAIPLFVRPATGRARRECADG